MQFNFNLCRKIKAFIFLKISFTILVLNIITLYQTSKISIFITFSSSLFKKLGGTLQNINGSASTPSCNAISGTLCAKVPLSSPTPSLTASPFCPKPSVTAAASEARALSTNAFSHPGYLQRVQLLQIFLQQHFSVTNNCPLHTT